MNNPVPTIRDRENEFILFLGTLVPYFGIYDNLFEEAGGM